MTASGYAYEVRMGRDRDGESVRACECAEFLDVPNRFEPFLERGLVPRLRVVHHERDLIGDRAAPNILREPLVAGPRTPVRRAGPSAERDRVGRPEHAVGHPAIDSGD